MLSTAITILFGHAVSMLVTFVAFKLKFRVTLAHWIANWILGATGAVAANYLLGGQYGPVLFGQTIVPMLAGAIVLPGLGSWAINKFFK
ncbi:hypothetical protein [Streptococcus orisratti]|nr:hypothetical protein [Streptococcus orisratti]